MNKNAISPTNQVLLNLYRHNKIVQKSIDIGKLRNGHRSYAELNLFRKQLAFEKIAAPLPYSSVRKKVLVYKTIFFLISIMFLSLGVLIFQKTNYWSIPHLSYAHFFIIKNIICAFCGFAGITGLLVFNSLNPAQEAIGQVVRNTKHRLLAVLKRKRVEYGVDGILTFGNAYRKLQFLKHDYNDANRKISTLEGDLQHLLQHIANSLALNAAGREHLYNQALQEFSDKLDLIVNSFKDTPVLTVEIN